MRYGRADLLNPNCKRRILTSSRRSRDNCLVNIMAALSRTKAVRVSIMLFRNHVGIRVGLREQHVRRHPPTRKSVVSREMNHPITIWKTC